MPGIEKSRVCPDENLPSMDRKKSDSHMIE
jgi:hypothetical protein